MGRKDCLPNPRARGRMAATRTRHLPQARFYSQNPTVPYLGPTHFRTRGTLTHVGLPIQFPYPLPPRRQALPEQRHRRSLLSTPNSACLPGKQSANGKEAPEVLRYGPTPQAVNSSEGASLWPNPRCRTAQTYPHTSAAASVPVDASRDAPSLQQPNTVAPRLPSHTCALRTTRQPAAPHQ